ncbi:MULTISPECIES: RTG family carbenicillin-hydrolyzing class A beta-lactamase [Psychrobacter]|jgi:beta-lactamase class A|uniref:RTG family carbenicillin-hydrolyzing class A beta-lactamase n=1 Tax=Psychrobacter TaxID=497 RepID=UPI001E5807F1|nr:RTG family carbenicillin-hydrolyzing class A beta-lactamase [Psychrobacter sp. CCUG 69069]MCD1278181.1 RTG family carbenicillin-hydrolyzing class A beta-lactamase [Psychrobacter sp. CCUG 69069]
MNARQHKAHFFRVIITFLCLTLSLNANATNSILEAVTNAETELGARIGLAVHDLETGKRWEYKSNERFPLSSTFKTLACANVLQRVDLGKERMDRVVRFSESNLVTYSPVTEKHVGKKGMSLAALCQATLSTSDNSAANFILQAIGGPKALTKFLRSVGDDTTRLDRWETELNEAVPGDKRDTTTPIAMVTTLEKLLVGETLSIKSRQQLVAWLKGNEVGDALFRKGVPNDWIVADRTGAGGYGTRAITAVMWPPNRKSIVAALYITETDASFEERNAVIAKIGEQIAKTVLMENSRH